MKRLIARAYSAAYQATGSKTLSFAVALCYVSALNLVIIYGSGILLQGLLPISFVLQLFTFPYIFAVIPAMLLLNYIIAPSDGFIAQEKKKRMDNSPIILYTAISAVLLTYTLCCDKLF
ncbi:MAG: hypothetical protein V4649_04230 [Bacteroidota bacterium]